MTDTILLVISLHFSGWPGWFNFCSNTVSHQLDTLNQSLHLCSVLGKEAHLFICNAGKTVHKKGGRYLHGSLSNDFTLKRKPKNSDHYLCVSVPREKLAERCISSNKVKFKSLEALMAQKSWLHYEQEQYLGRSGRFTIIYNTFFRNG